MCVCFCPLEKKQVLSCRGGVGKGRKLQFARSSSIWVQKACLSVWHKPTCAHPANRCGANQASSLACYLEPLFSNVLFCPQKTNFSNCSHDVLNIAKAEGSTGNIAGSLSLVALPGLLHIIQGPFGSLPTVAFWTCDFRGWAGKVHSRLITVWPTAIVCRMEALP